MRQPVYSVTALVGELRSVLEDTYQDIWVQGEISDLAKPASGHLYFSLKEGATLIRCALFSNRRRQFNATPEDGMQALLRGRVSVYEARGDLQLIVSYVEDAGEGALRREFERLKRKLAAEGLFDEKHKQPLPSYPKVIGVISSQRGAAVHDIRVTLARRYPLARLILYPTLVQGDEAADNIIHMLTVATQRREVDLLILARGGGSAEDLQAFNHEGVARAVFACKQSKLPVVSAIGHQTDFVITDLVADLRAPTPTAAAEAVSPQRTQLHATLRHESESLHRIMQRAVDTRRQNLDYTRARLGHPQHSIQTARQSLRAMLGKLGYLSQTRLNQHQLQMQQQSAQLRYHSPQAILARNLQHLRATRRRLAHTVTTRFAAATQTRRHLAHKLQLMNPANTLQRGYAILEDQQRKVVMDADKTQRGQLLTASVARGKLECVVERIVKP